MIRAEIARKRHRISDETIRPRFRPACREPGARSEHDRASCANGTLFASSASSHRFVFYGEDGAARRTDSLVRLRMAGAVRCSTNRAATHIHRARLVDLTARAALPPRATHS
ncbi:hypothetical protein [Burkholderia ambifaria]|uniref:hypothetical protein n=1 Tax=Burkholderia ambifaria TaxID=152480 RepID=UPI00158CE616|nr:hypothetical protein [Burkholderia ambifaria]